MAGDEGWQKYVRSSGSPPGMTYAPLEHLAARLSGAHDDRKIALMLPGGGMVATWQIAVLAEMEKGGLTEHIDMVVGASAGAMNGAYFAAKQAHVGINVYVEELSGKRFINPARVHKMMDIDYLVDAVLADKVRLDLDSLKNSHIALKIVITELTTGDAHCITGQHPEVLEALRATAAVPIAYGRAPRVGDSRYMDGGLSKPFPVDVAVQDGATDILAIVPKPPGTRWRVQTGVKDALLASWCVARSPEAGLRTYRRAPSLFDAGMAVCERGQAEDGTPVAALFPSDEKSLCRQFASSRPELARAAALGRRDGHRLVQRIYEMAEAA